MVRRCVSIGNRGSSSCSSTTTGTTTQLAPPLNSFFLQCDGLTPCQRCRKQGTQCTYELVENPSKAELRAEIRSLRQTIAALVPPAEPEAASERVNLKTELDNANSSTDSGLSLGEGDDKPNSVEEAKSEQAEGHDGAVIAADRLSVPLDSPAGAIDTQSLRSGTKPDPATERRFSAGISQRKNLSFTISPGRWLMIC